MHAGASPDEQRATHAAVTATQASGATLVPAAGAGAEGGSGVSVAVQEPLRNTRPAGQRDGEIELSCISTAAEQLGDGCALPCAAEQEPSSPLEMASLVLVVV